MINDGDRHAIGESDSAASCWCRGHDLTLGEVVSLGNPPEVEYVYPSVNHLHRRANACEDAAPLTRHTHPRPDVRRT